jgi:hypothetical protein
VPKTIAKKYRYQERVNSRNPKDHTSATAKTINGLYNVASLKIA